MPDESQLDEKVIIMQEHGYGSGAAHEYDTELTFREWRELSQEEKDKILDDAAKDAQQYIETYPRLESGYDLPE